MKKLWSVAAMVWLASTGVVQADALAPGERGVSYSYRVRSSLGPEWKIVMFPHGTSGGVPDEPQLLRVEGEGPYYCGRWHSPRFYAIRTTDAPALDGLSGEALQTFLDTDARVARSAEHVRVQGIRSMPESSGVEEVVDTFTVASVQGNVLTVSSQRRTSPQGDRDEVGRPPSTAQPAVPAATVDEDEDCSVASGRRGRLGIWVALFATGIWLVARGRRVAR